MQQIARDASLGPNCRRGVSLRSLATEPYRLSIERARTRAPTVFFSRVRLIHRMRACADYAIMNTTRLLIATLAISLTFVASPVLAQTETEWDGLVRVPSENIDAAYLAPDADFRPYTKVMIDPSEAAFERDWVRDYNRDAMGLSGRITDSEATRALQEVQAGLNEAFVEAYTAAGYQVVTTPGPDVLRLRSGVLNLTVSAPDQNTATRGRRYSEDAGSATLVVEMRDSLSGAILGRAVDGRVIDDNSSIQWRTRSSNRADFSRQFRQWAELSVQATNRLRSTTPPAAAPSS
jgi:hypothetical protein